MSDGEFLVVRRKHPWIPFLGVMPLSEAGIKYFNLDPRYKWNTFLFDWFDFGMMFAVWSAGEVSGNK